MPQVQNPKPATITIRLSEPLRTWVEGQADKFKITASEYLRFLVIERMERNG